ncbi:hypothetical protein CYY_009231 [Polysphondylium violaceum]|uniref:DUSP domain-containing protein n=1 Tax=Polysphondylium violaceum TaxID=133409 RepID=A0A8J4V366_9MYCE|nr:hypothetical protein CYY_009231 [Polysphondylium violaceum]
MWKVLIGFVPSIIKTLGDFRRFNDIYKNFSQQQKNVTLFHLGHWIRLRVGGVPFIVRRKTLNRYPESVFTTIVLDDKTSKKITDIFAKPAAIIEDFVSDRPQESSKTTRSSSKNLKNDKYYDIKNNTKQINNNIKDSPSSSSSSSSSLNIDQDEDNNKSIKDKETSTSSVGDEKHSSGIKFEKDFDGFYLIDRDPKYFELVLSFLRTGEVHVPPSYDINLLVCEAKFYHLHDLESILKNRILEERRKRERALVYGSEFDITQLDSKAKRYNFIIPKQWLTKWKQFIDGDNPPPDIIDNNVFFDSQDKLLNNLKQEQDYVCISKESWLLLNQTYITKGPIIIRTSTNIYDNPPSNMSTAFSIWNIK